MKLSTVWLMVPMVGLLLLAACRSAPTHFYTLEPTTSATSAPMSAADALDYRLDAVKVPVSVDRPQLVLSLGNGEVQLLESELWLAPLPEEIKSALNTRLREQLGAAGGARTTYHLRVQITRFVSTLGGDAWLQANWQVSGVKHEHLQCQHDFHATAGNSMVSLVQAHRQNVSALADKLVATLEALRDGASECPGGA